MTTKLLSDDQINQSISFLNHAFRDACEQYRKSHRDATNTKGSLLYGYQNEYSHLVNEIQRGPAFQAAQCIADANQLIAALKAEK